MWWSVRIAGIAVGLDLRSHTGVPQTPTVEHWLAGEQRAPLSEPRDSDFSLISEPIDSETTHQFTNHSCPWKHTQISGAAAGARTLATQGPRSNSARGLHAALGTPPSRIRQHREAGNASLGRRKAARGKAN